MKLNLQMTEVKKKAIFFIALMILAFIILRVFIPLGAFEGITVHSDGATIGEITDGKEVVQKFRSGNKGLNGIAILFATYGRVNTGNITVSVKDETGNEVFSESFDASTLGDNQYRYFWFDAIKKSANKDYTISLITSGASPSNAATVWSTSKEGYPDGTLSIGGEQSEKNIVFSAFYDVSYHATSLRVLSNILLVLAFCLLLAYSYISLDEKLKKHELKIKLGVMAVVSIFIAIAIAIEYSILVVHKFTVREFLTGDSFFRVVLLIPIFAFFVSHVIFEIKSLYDFIFRKRWFFALGVFLLLFLCKVSLSNVACFNWYIQPGIKTAYSDVLFGIPRGIRSDEWLVDLPRRISAEYTHYGKYNYICRATQNYNIASSYLHFSYSALSNPFNLGFYLFGSEFGVSFNTCALMMMIFMVSFELCYILSNKHRLVSLLGASLIAFSQFNLWWSLSSYFVSVPGIIVCSYYFLHSEKLRNKILFAVGVAFSGSTFVCSLYPAWQVPFAYILIALFAWVVIDNFDKIKQMKKYDWFIVCGAFLFMVSVIGAYLLDIREYTASITETVYPGKRFSAGGMALQKPSWFIQSLLYPFNDIGNSSEAGVFFSLFPLPMLFGLYIAIRQIIEKIKNKANKIDLCNVFLLVVAAFLTLYCSVGIPEWLAKITLISYSTPERAVDFLGFVNVLFIIRLIRTEDRMKLPVSVSVVASIALVAVSTYMSAKYYPNYMIPSYTAIISVLTFAFAMVLISQKISVKVWISTISVVIVSVIVSGLVVLPFTRGLDALIKKPASNAIQQVVEKDPDAKWIGYGNIITGQYLIANGAPTVNSVNYVPNMELWQKLDPDGKYNEVYNRYAHVTVVLSEEETKFTLSTPDSFLLNLSYGDIETVGVKYIFSMQPLSESTDIIDYNLLYEEGGIFIYEIVKTN